MTSLTLVDIANLAYRPCVGVALFNPAGKVFVGERIDTPDAWQMPQGGRDPGEDIETCARRELWEETGLTENIEILKIADKTICYDLPVEYLMRGDQRYKTWGNRYKGQEQTWVAALYTGSDNAVNLTAHEPQEFSRWQWVELTETVNLIVPFKQDVYRQVCDLFADIAQALKKPA